MIMDKEGATLASYISKLKPDQQMYIVFCVRKWTVRKDFHRGILPFLPCRVAQQVLLRQQRALGIHDRYIRQIISVFAEELKVFGFEKCGQTQMRLNDAKLAKKFRQYSDFFIVKAPFLSSRSTRLIELRRKDAKANCWYVYTDAKELDRATTYLAENFR